MNPRSPLAVIAAVMVGMLLGPPGAANNIRITNVSTFVTGTVTQIQFDLAWDNSWRTSSGPSNYDAAWVFFKYKADDGTWKHLDLTGANNVPASAFALIVPADRKGAFIHRSVDGVGSVNLFAMRVGVVQVAGNHDVKAFAVEMVYVPQGSFLYR